MPETCQYSTDQNHIYTYFQCIEELEPASVIDFGMFLHRIGAVSREAMEKRIGEQVKLWGVSYGTYPIPAVYQTIYHKIVPAKKLCDIDELFELAVLLDLKPTADKEERRAAALWARNHARYLLTDKDVGGEYQEYEKFGTVHDFHVERQEYIIVEIGR